MTLLVLTLHDSALQWLSVDMKRQKNIAVVIYGALIFSNLLLTLNLVMTISLKLVKYVLKFLFLLCQQIFMKAYLLFPIANLLIYATKPYHQLENYILLHFYHIVLPVPKMLCGYFCYLHFPSHCNFDAK
jgi:hypothetical protein